MHVDAERVLAHCLDGPRRREDDGEEAGEPLGILVAPPSKMRSSQRTWNELSEARTTLVNLDGDGLASDLGEGVVLARVLVERRAPPDR